MPVALADEVTVDDRCVIRALSADTAGGEGVGFSMVMGDGIVVDHGVHIAAGNEKAKPRLPQGSDGVRVSPIRLGENADLIACVLQYPADDGVAKGRVIDVGVADDIDEIALAPTSGGHIAPGDG